MNEMEGVLLMKVGGLLFMKLGGCHEARGLWAPLYSRYVKKRFALKYNKFLYDFLINMLVYSIYLYVVRIFKKIK